MKILNEKRDDLANDMMIPLGIMFYCTWASEVIAYKMAETLDRIGARKTLVQQKKMHFRQARKMVDGIIKHLEVCFDEDFEKAGNNGEGFTDVIQYNANDVIEFLLIYFSRSDTDWEKRDRMKQALLNFKGDPSVDLQGLLKLFKMQR